MDVLSSSRAETTGDIPPQLSGSSVTVVANRLYVFGGRLIVNRRMLNDLYLLNLETFVWNQVSGPANAPQPRYFHTTNVWKNNLVVFGGMGMCQTAQDGQAVLPDIALFDLTSQVWKQPETKCFPDVQLPKARYAHLSVVQDDRLVVIGGQDKANNYIEETNVLDLNTMTWILNQKIDKHCGAYRSIVVAGPTPTFPVDASTELSLLATELGHESENATPTPDSVKPKTTFAGLRAVKPVNAASDKVSTPVASTNHHQKDNKIHLPTNLYLYSNYNFTAVRRDLQLLTASADSDEFEFVDRSDEVKGSSSPPGLRFPNGAIVGNSLVFSGTYLTNSSQTFCIWSLNLTSFEWTRIDAGAVFSHGSWNRGVLWDTKNSFIVLGNKSRALVEDYNHRLTNFNHITLIDFEAFGIYSPPISTMTPMARELGLEMLSDPNASDMEILTQDCTRINCNSGILNLRWPLFSDLLQQQKIPLTNQNERTTRSDSATASSLSRPISLSRCNIIDRSRVLFVPYPHSVCFALLQFLYTDSLTAYVLESPEILSVLLLLAASHQLPRLAELTLDGLHRCLNVNTAALVYETAALGGRTGLQIRALKVMIYAKRMLAQRKNKENGSSNTTGSSV